MSSWVLVISGTPGTGKSALAKFLGEKLAYQKLELKDYYKQISAGYDRKKQCYKIDLKKLEKLVKKKKKENKEGIIVDSHVSHLLPKRIIDICIVLVCSDLKKLEKRLKEKKYSKKKIRENLDAEIFQICLMEAKENRHKVIVVDSDKRIKKKELLKKIRSLLKN